jgi:5-oxoprolinase (ATP-hydrolysing)
VIRQIQFLQPMTVSLLTQRRGTYPPFGLHGGKSGEPGENQLRRATGEMEQLSGAAQIQVQTGDMLTLKTPGGGGWGVAE